MNYHYASKILKFSVSLLIKNQDNGKKRTTFFRPYQTIASR